MGRARRCACQAEAEASYMTDAPAERLNAEHYESNAEECRALARKAKDPSHCTMLQHMAEAWERMANSFRTGR